MRVENYTSFTLIAGEVPRFPGDAGHANAVYKGKGTWRACSPETNCVFPAGVCPGPECWATEDEALYPNPTDPFGLTPMQQSRGISLHFDQPLSQFRMRWGRLDYPGPPKRFSAKMLLAGASNIEYDASCTGASLSAVPLSAALAQPEPLPAVDQTAELVEPSPSPLPSPQPSAFWDAADASEVGRKADRAALSSAQAEVDAIEASVEDEVLAQTQAPTLSQPNDGAGAKYRAPTASEMHERETATKAELSRERKAFVRHQKRLAKSIDRERKLENAIDHELANALNESVRRGESEHDGKRL